MLSKIGLKFGVSRQLCGNIPSGWRHLGAAAQQLKSSSRPESHVVEDTKSHPVDLATSESDSGEQLGPCILGIFSGKINKNLLVYPELDTTEEVEAVHKLAEPVEKFFTDHVDSAQLDARGSLTPELLSGLRSLGLFGQPLPETLGGRGLSAVAQARLAEAVSADAGVELTLRAHNCLGLRALLTAGSPEQLARLAGPLASGERLAALCLAEPGGGGGFADPRASVRATASLDITGEFWLLNGSKVWVTNGPIADLFVVFAVVHVQPSVGEGEPLKRITAFLVEREQPGVSVGPAEPKLGARAAATGALHLTDVRVTPQNLLGDVGDGLRLARQATTWARLSAGPAVAGTLKRLLASAAVRCTTGRRAGPGAVRTLSELPLVQRRLARLAGLTYATESVSYLLAFLADQFPDADLTAEAAALSLLSSQAAVDGALEVATLAGGGRACAAGGEFPHERELRDAWAQACVDSPGDLVRLQLAGRGIRSAAEEAAGTALRFASARSFLERLRLLRKQPSVGDSSDTLAVHYHHNLAGVANSLEVHTEGFSKAVRYCLHYYKAELPNEQMLLCRMADCAVDLFTLLACCARASRSKSIGLRSADHELDLLVMLSKEISLRLEHNISGLDLQRLYTRHPDGEFRRVSDYTCKFGGYSVDHAIARNWN